MFTIKVSPNTDDKKRLAVACIITVVPGLFGTLSALFVTSLDPSSLWDLILLLVGLFGSTLTGVFLLGVLTKRGHSRGVVFGIVASMTTLIVIRNLENNPVPGILTSAVGVLTCVFVGYLASLLIPGPKQSLGNLTIHTLEAGGESQ